MLLICTDCPHPWVKVLLSTESLPVYLFNTTSFLQVCTSCASHLLWGNVCVSVFLPWEFFGTNLCIASTTTIADSTQRATEPAYVNAQTLWPLPLHSDPDIYAGQPLKPPLNTWTAGCFLDLLSSSGGSASHRSALTRTCFMLVALCRVLLHYAVPHAAVHCCAELNHGMDVP